jgi:hypothetical protein
MKRLVMFSVLLLVIGTVDAQESAEVGLVGAVSHYYGDITNQKMKQSVAPLMGLFYLRNLNTRFAIKTGLYYGQLKSDGTFNEQQTTFSKRIAEFSVQLQVNYLDYILGNDNYKFSPYLALGVGTLYFDNDKESGVVNGVWRSSNGNNITAFIPLSFGFNYSLSPKWGIGAEINVQKTFSDEIDHQQGNKMYKDPLNLEATSNVHNNDWISWLGIHISYLFYTGKKPCPSLEGLN